MGCYGCTKCSLVSSTSLTIFLGVIAFAGGVVLIFKGNDFFPELDEYSRAHYPICTWIIVLGLVLLVLGSLGVIAAMRRNICLLHTYFFTLLILTFLEIAALVYVVIKREPFISALQTEYRDWFRNVNYWNYTDLQLLGVSVIQLSFHCCGLGADGTFYWTQWDFGNKVPASCCGNRANPHSTSFFCTRYDQELRGDSCDPYLDKTLSEYLLWAGVGLLGFLILVNLCQMHCSRRARRHYDYDDSGYSDSDQSAAGDFTRYSALETASTTKASTVNSTKASTVNSTWL